MARIRSRRVAQRDYNEKYRQKLGECGRPTKAVVSQAALAFVLDSIWKCVQGDKFGQAESLMTNLANRLETAGYDIDEAYDVVRRLCERNTAASTGSK